MTRDEIKKNILQIFETEFEIVDPGLDDNLTEEHDFDSIDALELLGEIEKIADSFPFNSLRLSDIKVRVKGKSKKFGFVGSGIAAIGGNAGPPSGGLRRPAGG